MTIDMLLQRLKTGATWTLAKVLVVCALLALVWLLASKAVALSYLYLPSFQGMSGASDVTGQQSDTPAGYQLSGGISELNLFGKYQAVVAPPPPPPEPEAPKVTKLKLELHGLLAMSNPRHSSAVISQLGKATKVYGVGDTLPGNAELLEIHADHVVVGYSGEKQTLWFGKDKSVATASKATPVESKPAPVAATKFQRDEIKDLAQEYGLQSSSIASLTKKFTGNPSRQDIRDYYDELNKVPANELFNTVATEFESNPDGFVKQLGLKAQRSRGYLVTSKIPKQYVDAYNLQYGDRILEINGQQLGNPSRDRTIFSNIREAGQATVKLQRGRQITTVTVPVMY